ncbi:unnamed protein product [Lactuca virosa]|uniref:Uncharacterized protein n=1 Tax=Lactuca virosa TaxID=75947 RepID=A0AAU9NET0_9ASTR|nr:unnamed protein product [Lactuca virosa]
MWRTNWEETQIIKIPKFDPPVTSTTASSGSTTALLLPSSQYSGDRRGKKEQGLGFVWVAQINRKEKEMGVRLEWFYGGRICSGSRWSLVVE